MSRLLRGRLRSTLRRRAAAPSISVEPFYALSLEASGATLANRQRRSLSGGGDDECTIEQLLEVRSDVVESESDA